MGSEKVAGWTSGSQPNWSTYHRHLEDQQTVAVEPREMRVFQHYSCSFTAALVVFN